MRSPWRFIAAGFGLIFLFSALLLAVLPQGRNAPAQTVPSLAPAPRGYLVANSDIAAGALLLEQNLDWRPHPTGDFPADAITGDPSIEAAAIGTRTRRVLLAGQMIRRQDLAPKNEGSPLASLLNPGMRAVTVPIDAMQATASGLTPNDRIDIISMAPAMPGQAAAPPPLALNNVRILAIAGAKSDKTVPAGPLVGDTRGSLATAITVELPPRLVPQLTAAAAGPLAFIVRRRGDLGQDGVSADRNTVVPEKERRQSRTADQTRYPPHKSASYAPPLTESGVTVIRGQD